MELQPLNPRNAALLWREVARQAMELASEYESQFQMKFVITASGDIVKDLSPNQRLHWRVRSNRTKRWRAQLRRHWVEMGSIRFHPGVSVRITIRRGRRVDPDNASASCKVGLDSLWGDDGMLGADDERWVKSYEVVQETGSRWKGREEVEICVRGEVL